MKNMFHMIFLFSAVVALRVVSPATAGQASAGVTLGVPTTNSAVRMDADSDYLEIPSTSTFPVAGDASFTLEMWFNMDSLPSTGGALAGWGNEGNALMTYLAITPEGYIWFNHWGIDNLYYSGLATGVWTHVAAVHDGTAHTDYVYVNGGLIGSYTVPVLNVARTKLRLGQHPNVPSYGFRGSMDEVRLWSVVRSPEEIAGAMNQTLPGAVAGLDARWSMDEGTGAQANDTAGAGHHAAFIGTPTWGVRGVLATTLNQTYDGTARIVGALTQPAGLHVDITYDGNPWGPTNAGSYAVTGTVVDLTYQGATTGTLVVAKAAQTITFENPGPQETTNETPIVATASSGLPVTLAVISGPATLSATVVPATIGFISLPPTTLSPATLTYSGAGDVTITATQAGDANWETATTVTNTFTVSLTPQAVLGFTPTSPQAYNTTNALSVSGGSGTGAVSYAVSSGPGAIVGDTNLWVSAGTGTVTVVATKAQDDLYLATSATGTVTAAKAAQTISFENPGPQVTTNETPIIATASSGLPVTLAVISGPATLSSTVAPATIGFIPRPPTTLSPATSTYYGAGDVTIAATQAGDANWEDATTATNTFTVSLTPQAVLGFTPTSPQAYNTTNALSVSGGSGTGAVSYAVSSGPGVIVGGTSLWVSAGTGTVTVVATKAQDDLYLATSTTSTVAAAKTAQTISFENPGAQVTTNVTALTASASSGLPVTLAVISGPATLSTNVSPATLTYNGAGDVTIAATQAGDGNWEAATEATNTFTVSLAPQAVLGFTPTSPQAYNTTNALSVSGGSGTGAVSYAVSSGPGAIVGGASLWVSAGTGTVTVVATKAQDDLYLATSATGTVTAAKAVQTISFENPGPQVTTSETPIVATASSGLPVTLAVISGPATLSATVAPATIGFIPRPPTTLSPATSTYYGAGDVTIAATQAGDANWEAALPVTNTFTVSLPVMTSPVHRFWSDSLMSHFFTASEAEKENLIATMSQTWRYEGIAFYAHTQAQETTKPVHRFWSLRLGTHLFTISDKEKAQLESRFPKAFMYEGHAFHAFNDQAPGTLPVYRLWNPLLKRGFFTISEAEKANVIASKIWRYEGIAWYAYPTAEIVQPPIPEKQDQYAAQADMPPLESVVDPFGVAASEILFSLSYDSNSVVEAMLFDPWTNGFTQVLAPTVAPCKLEIPSLPAGQRYWLSVMSRHNDEDGATLDYGGWLGRVAEIPTDEIETVEVEEGADVLIGLPVETIALPESKATLVLRLYERTGAGDDLLIVTRTGLKGGSTCELAVPAWNSWYRVELADETGGVALESFWIGHLRTH